MIHVYVYYELDIFWKMARVACAVCSNLQSEEFLHRNLSASLSLSILSLSLSLSQFSPSLPLIRLFPF